MNSDADHGGRRRYMVYYQPLLSNQISILRFTKGCIFTEKRLGLRGGIQFYLLLKCSLVCKIQGFQHLSCEVFY